MSLVHFLVGITLLFSFQVVGATSITTLAEARPSLVVPSYTAAERQTLADQAYLFISQLYVHRDIKIKDFGKKADPLNKLRAIKKYSTHFSNEELHQRISGVFTQLHDLHTNYIAPKPLSCAATFIPLRFESVLDGEQSSVLVSAKLALQAQSIEGIEVGDQLLSINGKSVENVLRRLGKISGGANPEAMRVRAIEMLSLRSLSTQKIPQEDSLVLKFRRKDQRIEKTVPWFAYRNLECEGINSKEETPVSFRRSFNIFEDEFQKKYNRIFGNPRLVNKSSRWAAESILDEVFEVATINTKAGVVGYVQLKGFSWDNQNLDISTVVEGFRRVIENRLSNAIGLVIDVRGNPGGYIVFAEKLIQLFSHKEVEPTKVQMLANALNESIFLKSNGEDNRWSTAISTAMKANHKMIVPMTITPSSEANSLGQIWFRPVVVLTDASCFSACDLFAAGMQDNDAAVVIGVHKTTGAGGANVMEHRIFRQIMGDTHNPFETLPFSQNMRVSWRQSIRAGKNEGVLIEDAGVKSDIVVPLRPTDISGESKELMTAINDIIAGLQLNYKSGLTVRQGSSILLANGQEAKWTERIYGVDAIDLFVEKTKVSTVELKSSSSPEEVPFVISGLNKDWSDQPVTLIGKKDGKQVFRVVRELTWRGDYSLISEAGLSFIPESGVAEPLHIMTLKGKDKDGWQFVDGKLRVGPKGNYENGLLTRAFIPLQLNKQGGSVIIDISVKAEEENDSLRIYIANPDTFERMHVFAGSSLSEQKGVSIPLPASWDRADVVFEFESDENWNMVGPVIENIKVVK